MIVEAEYHQQFVHDESDDQDAMEYRAFSADANKAKDDMCNISYSQFPSKMLHVLFTLDHCVDKIGSE